MILIELAGKAHVVSELVYLTSTTARLTIQGACGRGNEAVPCRVYPESPNLIPCFTGQLRTGGNIGRGSDMLTVGVVSEMAAVPVRAVAPLVALDTPDAPRELEWGELRSACAARDWQRAWGVVGTDHAGAWTVGELYLLDKARRARAVAAALLMWRHIHRNDLDFGMLGVPEDRKFQAACLAKDALWQRLKLMAAWESDAVAQRSEALRRMMAAAVLAEAQHQGAIRVSHFALTVNGEVVELQAPNFETAGSDIGAAGGDRTAAIYARREPIKGKFQMDIGDDELPDELVQLRAKADRCFDKMLETAHTIRRIKAVAADHHTPPVKLIGGDDETP